VLALKTGKRLVETGGGSRNRVAAWLDGAEDLIESLGLPVEIGVCDLQFSGGFF
jgi:hypothetical protein